VHLDDLRAVNDFDPAVVTIEPTQLRLDPGPIAGEVKPRNIRKIPQGERGAFDQLRRAIIVAHGIEHDFHQRIRSEIE
jgi:hypothetical protein